MRNTILIAALLAAGAARADSPADLAAGYTGQARARTPAFVAAPSRGERFFRVRHGHDWSCSSCHTDHPAGAGRHAVTGRAIEPLAPAVNSSRFTRPAKVEKWFRRNCNDVIGRECTAAEKADVLAWLMTLR